MKKFVIIILKGMKICLILCVWLTCLKYHLETKVLIVRIQVWDMTLCHWESGS